MRIVRDNMPVLSIWQAFYCCYGLQIDILLTVALILAVFSAANTRFLEPNAGFSAIKEGSFAVTEVLSGTKKGLCGLDKVLSATRKGLFGLDKVFSAAS